MKKVLTLMAFALLSIGANAQTWSVGSSAPTKESKLVDNELVTIETVYATTRKTQSGDNALAGDYSKTAMIQVRTNTKPNETTPTGEENSGSTPLVITAKKDISVTFYYRRQCDSGNKGVFTNDSGKDMLCYAQNGKEFSTDEELITNIDDDYANVKKTCKFYAGGIYTMYATGTTIGLFCLDVVSSVTATAPKFDPEGGEVMAFSTITLTSDGAVYYQWSDDATAPEIGAEGWTAGSTVEVPDMTGTKYLHAYATNGDGLESEVVSQTYNITEFTLTAVTNKTWTFTTDGGWPKEDVGAGEEIRRDNLIVVGGNSFKFDGSVLALGGVGTATSRNVQFMVAPRSRISIKCNANSSGRTLNIDLNEFGKTIGTISVPTTAAEYPIDYTGTEEGALFVYSAGSGMNLYSIKVEPLPTEEVSVGAAGYATYVSENALAFTGNIKAYVATKADGNTVTLEQVTKLPKETPALLYSETVSDSEEVLVIADEDAETITDNYFKAGDGQTEYSYTPEKRIYVLNTVNVTPGFYRANNTVVAKGKAYLDLSDGSEARFAGMFFEGETTGISQVESNQNAEKSVYNLNGQRVAQPTKGLYIVNGKKVIIK